MIDFSLITTSFGLIFLAELPDKTALATTVLSSGHSKSPSKHAPLLIWLGVCSAFLLHTLIAVLMGQWISSLAHPQWIRWISALIFLIFAYLNWEASRSTETDGDSESQKNKTHGPFLQSFLMIAVAEAGDLTQVTTLMLAANHQNTLSVFIGAMTALACVAGLAVTLGKWIGKTFPQKKIQMVSAFVFLGIAVFLLNPLDWF